MLYASYNITISGYGYTKTYKNLESQLHDEMFVQALDLFYHDLKALEIVKEQLKIPKYNIFIEEVKCSYEKVWE